MSSKKIGILTFHRGPNHGGYLQAYELAQAVKQLGYTAEIINYQNPTHFETERFKPWVYRRPQKLWHAFRKNLAFRKAVAKLPLSKFTLNKDDINWEQYQAVLIGADVVWDYSQERLGQDKIYFGDFKNKFKGKLIAYAPSCGMAKPDQPIPDWIKSHLQEFNSLSVRDETTQRLVSNTTGIKPLLVCDPTWLPLSDPIKEEGLAEPCEKYIAVYGFRIESQFADEIQKYARKRGLKIYASGYTHAWADRNFSALSPMEWVDFLTKSTCVFAGTFHGALYATRLGKRFAILPNAHIKAKLATPLHIAGLEAHVIKSASDVSQILDKPVDINKTIDKLKPFVDDSLSYLKDALS